MEEWKFVPARDFGLSFGKRLRSLRRESGLIETIFHILWWSAIRWYLRLYHRMEIRGAGHLPKEAPFVLVANHTSHLDALVLTAPFPARLRDRIFPIAAGDTFFEKLPLAVFAAYALNALPLWRKNCDPQDLEELRRRLVEEPCAYALFPEGTRSQTGQMGLFRRGIGGLVAGSHVPVVPCYIDGAFEAWPRHRIIPRPYRLTLTVGPPLWFDSFTNDKDGWTQIAAKVEAEVREMKSRQQNHATH